MTAWLLVLLGCTCAPEAGPDAAGKWFEVSEADPDLTDEERAQIEQLEAIGYAQGTQAGSAEVGVVTWDRERAVPSLMFYTSGHAPEATLRTLDGEVLHTWGRGFRWSFPLYPVRLDHGSTQTWRRARLRDDGSVVAIHEGLGIVSVDADSSLQWAVANRAHHDLVLTGDGGVLHLAREAHPLDGFEAPVLEDYVVWLDRDGTEVRRVSILAALLDSPWASWLDASRERGGDLLHTNTLEVLGPRDVAVHPAFTEGRLLLSFRTLSALAVLEPSTGELVWALRGDFRKQHDPTVTTDGRLLLFDNAGQGRDRARVLQVDPDSGAALWQWPPEGEPQLSSYTLGAVSELAGGHLLVTESEAGRAIEITPDGEVVWEWHSPHRAGDDGEFVAALFEVLRELDDDVPAWASGPADAGG
jgi:hypothetical protein